MIISLNSINYLAFVMEIVFCVRRELKFYVLFRWILGFGRVRTNFKKEWQNASNEYPLNQTLTATLAFMKWIQLSEVEDMLTHLPRAFLSQEETTNKFQHSWFRETATDARWQSRKDIYSVSGYKCKSMLNYWLFHYKRNINVK